MSNSPGVSLPIKRAPRPICGMGRGTGCQLGGDNAENSINTQRVQFLIARSPMPVALAATVATLIWGGARG